MNVLALTDHDTMAGIPEAVAAARRFGIKIIPGVEISTIFYSRLLFLPQLSAFYDKRSAAN